MNHEAIRPLSTPTNRKDVLSRWVGGRGAITANASSVGYVTLLRGLSRLPPPLAFRLAGSIGERRFAQQHSSLAPRVEMTALQFGVAPKVASGWLREAFRRRTCEHLENWLHDRWTKDNLAEYVEIRGLEHLSGALDAGRGVILTSGHFNSIVSMFIAIGVLGYPETVIRPSRVPKRLHSAVERWFHSRWLDFFEQKLDGKFLWTTPPSPFIATHALQALRRNELVVTLVDLWNTSQTVDLEFMGMSVPFPRGAYQLAVASGAPILFARLSRPASLAPLVITIEPPIVATSDARESVQRQAAALEAAIRDDPPTWSSMLFRI